MITAFLVLLQVTDSVTAITVREGDRTATVPIVFTPTGPLVRGDQVFPALGARLLRIGRERINIQAGGTTVELTLGLPAARVGGEVVPLVRAPVERDGVLYVPLGIIEEIMPRFAVGYSYDQNHATITHYVPLVAPLSSPTLVAPRQRRGSGRSQASDDQPWTVVVDAGHGGPDRGMKGPIGAMNKIEEADITLGVARRLRDSLRVRGAQLARGVDVVMTRSTDTLIALADRGRIANKAQADLFLSIHVNAANPRWPNPRAASGFETYFLSDAKTEDEKRVEEMENDASKYDLDVSTDPGDPLSYLLTDMRENEHLRESSVLAATMQRGLGRARSGLDRGVKQAGFRVLVTAHMPAVLIEVGFGTNPGEARYLASAAGQQQLAGAIANATIEYLEQYRLRRRSASVGSR
jgi:N-acetylmuramoyl-L-alanine amidase